MMEPLVLAHDTAISAPPLKHHLENWAGHNDARQALAGLLIAMAEGSVPVAQRLAQGHLTGDPTAVIDTNHSGDNQKALDIAAHEHFVEHMRGFSVARILSEEANTVIELDPNGKFDVAMDPIDGSGSIGIGAPLGALFAVFPAGESFLRPGREMIGAAYVSFGHSVDFGFSVGDGVSIATLKSNQRRFSRRYHRYLVERRRNNNSFQRLEMQRLAARVTKLCARPASRREGATGA